MRERSLKTVVNGKRERQRAENGEHDQKERPQRVHRESCGVEQQLEEVAHQLPEPRLDSVPRPLPPHTDYFAQIHNAQFGELLVVHLVVRQPRLAFPHAGLVFEIVPLLLVGGDVRRLPFEDGVRALHHGRKHGVHRSQHDGRKHNDTQPDGEGAQQRKYVDRLGRSQRLPYPIGHVKKRSQTGHAFGDADHIPAQGQHLLIEIAQHLVQVVEIRCERCHGYQYLSEGLP